IVAIQLARFLIGVGNPLNEGTHNELKSDAIAAAAQWAPWVLDSVDVPPGLALALALALALDAFVARTAAGLELTIAGASPSVARATGFSPARATWRAFLLGGALAGLSGALTI